MSLQTVMSRPIAERVSTLVRAHPDLSAIGLLLIVSLVIRVRYLFRPFHGDEMITFSKMVLGRDFGGIILGPFDSNSHLLNSLIMKAVYLGAGEIPALMRLPNLVFVLLAIMLLYVMCAGEFGRVTAFAAALIFSLHPAMVLFSVWGRGYAGMVLFTLISSCLFLQLLRSFSWRRWLLCSTTGFLAGTAHLFAVNVLIAQALLALLFIAWPEKGHSEDFLARAKRMGPVILGPVIALALLFAIYLPQMLVSSTESFHYSFQTAFPLALVNFLGGNTYRTDVDVFSLLILALALLGLFSLKENPILKTYSGLLFLAPVSLYGLSYLAPVFTLHPRFFVFLLPFTCLLFVAGLKHTADTVRAKTGDHRRASMVIRGAACLCVVLVAVIFIDRIKVPRGRALIRAQRVVGDFIDNHPDAQLLTNDTGFVRVRLRQEGNMDRIRPALGIRPIRAFQAQEPTGAIYFIYVPRKRQSESALIHFQGRVTPEVLHRRDDSLRAFLTKNATIEVDLAPMLQIYAIRPQPEATPE